MGWRVVSLIFALIGIACLPFWPYPHPWPAYGSLAICGFCFFVCGLTFLVSIFAKHGGAIWKGRGHG
jgi:hypothetical protein